MISIAVLTEPQSALYEKSAVDTPNLEERLGRCREYCTCRDLPREPLIHGIFCVSEILSTPQSPTECSPHMAEPIRGGPHKHLAVRNLRLASADEINVVAGRDESGIVGAAQQFVNRPASGVAVVDRPVIDVHAHKPIRQVRAHIASVL